MYVTRRQGDQTRRIWYESIGTAVDASVQCLVLHGGPGFTSATLRCGMDELAASCPVTLVDLVGCGQSSRHPGSGYQSEDYVEDVRVVLGVLGRKPVVLVGHGWGAILATKVSLALLDRIVGIVMINPLRILGAGGQDNDAQARAIAACDPSLLDRYGPMATLATRGLSGDLSAWDAIDASSWPREMFATQFASPPPMRWRADMTTAAFGYESYFAYKGGVLFQQQSRWTDYDLREEASRLRQHVCLMVSESDANYVAPLSLHAQPLLESMPGARLTVFEHCGHFLPVEAPSRFAEVFQDFASECTGRSSKRLSREVT